MENDKIAMAAVAGIGLAYLLSKSGGGGGGGEGGDPQILSLTIPATSPGGQFWPTASLKLPQADGYQVRFHVVLANGYSVNIMHYDFATSVADPDSAQGSVITLLDRPDNTYALRGQGYIAVLKPGTDPTKPGSPCYPLYQTVMQTQAANTVAGQAYVALENEINAIDRDWDNWLLTHPLGMMDPYYLDLRARLTAAWELNLSTGEAYQAALDAYYACVPPPEYTKQAVPAQAIDFSTLYDLPLARGSYDVTGSIFQINDGESTEFDFGKIGTLVVS